MLFAVFLYSPAEAGAPGSTSGFTDPPRNSPDLQVFDLPRGTRTVEHQTGRHARRRQHRLPQACHVQQRTGVRLRTSNLSGNPLKRAQRARPRKVSTLDTRVVVTQKSPCGS